VLAADAVAQPVEVRQILLAWRQLARQYRGELNPRAQARTRAETLTLARSLLSDVRAGADFAALMAEHSEDAGTAAQGSTYAVGPGTSFVPPFERLSRRLAPGQVGLVESAFGFHLIQRVR
jgi:parvulin-like peptidyl-prolyl isomerase